MIQVIIVGEDNVTRAIIKRLIAHICPNGIQITREDPVRGGQIKSKAPNYNRLAQTTRVIMLADLDTGICPPSEQQVWVQGDTKHAFFMFRFAYDEAENWLLADREGFAKFLEIEPGLIPLPTPKGQREPNNMELRLSTKASLFIMLDLVPKSKNSELKTKLSPKDRFSKGPEWNSTLVPFIENHWDVEAAKTNSYSLQKMYKRVAEWCINAAKPVN